MLFVLNPIPGKIVFVGKKAIYFIFSCLYFAFGLGAEGESRVFLVKWAERGCSVG